MKYNYVTKLNGFVDWLNDHIDPTSPVRAFCIDYAYGGKQLAAIWKEGGITAISSGYQPAKDCYLSALENFLVWSKYLKKGE